MKKVVLLALSAVSMAFAQGSLWGMNTTTFPSLQVKTPQVTDCWGGGGDEDTCYSQIGGWWFGYDYGGGSIQLFKEGSWTNFGPGVGLTDENDGSPLIQGGLSVKLTAQSSNGTAYGGSGFGFNYWGDQNTSYTENITSRNGYCITYSSNGALIAKLGHDETLYTADCTYDMDLPSTSGAVSAVKLPFASFALPSWCPTATSFSDNLPLVPSKPTGIAASFKIAVGATQSTSPTIVDATIYQLGWHTDNCNTDVASIRYGSVAAASVNYKMVGRSFTLNSIEKPVAVQVINLQGAVVYSQTLTSASKTMNLSNLPTGVYMLRAPALGFTNKVILK